MYHLTCLVYVIIPLVIRGMDIPQGALFLNNTGLVVEPEAFLVHYDEVKYLSVGAKIGFHSVKTNNIKQCSANSTISELLRMSEIEVSSFLDTIPTHFNSVSQGYCEDGLLDCYLEGRRGKRSVVAAGAILARITVADIGLYHHISMGDIKERLAKVNKHLERLDENFMALDEYDHQYQSVLDGNFMALDEYDHQYQSVEEDVIRKIWHGEENLEKILNDLGCEDLSGVVELSTKKGSKQDCDNYRGISVTGTLSTVYGKILEAKVGEVGGLGHTTLLL